MLAPAGQGWGSWSMQGLRLGVPGAAQEGWPWCLAQGMCLGYNYNEQTYYVLGTILSPLLM